jgi:predicted dienelactone hydrolase
LLGKYLIKEGLAAGNLLRFELSGDFKGALQTTSSEPHSVLGFGVGGSQALIVAGAGKCLDFFIDFCHSMLLIADPN